jgi:hypothetical protein
VILNARCRLLTIRSCHPWCCFRVRASLRLSWPASAIIVRILGNNALNPPSSRAPARRSDVSGEDGTKAGGARSPARARRRQNWCNKSPRRVGQVGIVESSAHRTVPLARIRALSRQTSTFQTPSKPATRTHALSIFEDTELSLPQPVN